MIVTFLSGKYRCGSDLGIYAKEKEGYLENLNKVIDFQNCIYPEKYVESEDKTKYVAVKMTPSEFFEGKEQKLEPGHMFVHEGQVFAIDTPDRLVLTLSETGALAVDRFLKDILEAELKLRHTEPDWDTRDVTIAEITEIPEEKNEISIPYYLGKAWREGTNLPEKFKIKFCSNYSLTPVELYISGQTVYYAKDEFTQDEVDYLITEILCYTYQEGLGEEKT